MTNVLIVKLHPAAATVQVSSMTNTETSTSVPKASLNTHRHTINLLIAIPDD
jgi:hypothetical protein